MKTMLSFVLVVMVARLSAQSLASVTPQNITIQICKNCEGENYPYVCSYSFKNTGSSAVSLTLSRDTLSAYPAILQPGGTVDVDWHSWAEGKKSRLRANISFERNGQHFEITVSRRIDTLRRPLLLATDTAFFELGHVPYAQQHGYTIGWKVKNISTMTVMCPDEVDVWNDVQIMDRFARLTPLAAGQTRTVKLNIHWFPRESNFKWHKQGCIKAFGDNKDQRYVQRLFLKVEGYFDLPVAADTLRH